MSTRSTPARRTTPAATWSPTSRSARRWPTSPDASTRVPTSPSRRPTVSADGKTVTVKLRDGVRFSPPVKREVTSADVKYAIERGFFGSVNNPYAPAYFGDVVGAKLGAKPGTTISGISTPDAHTVVFKLRRPTGGTLAAALVLPLAAPVPREYALPLDRAKVSEYGAQAGRDRPVHGRLLRAGQEHHARPQPELEREDRLPPRVPGPDRDAAGQRRPDRRVAPDPGGLAHGARRLHDPAGGAQAGVHQDAAAAQAGRLRRRPLGGAEHAGRAVRQRQRPQGRAGRLRSPGRADGAGRREGRHRRDPLPAAGHARLRSGRRREGHRRRLPRQADGRSGRGRELHEGRRLRVRPLRGRADPDGRSRPAATARRSRRSPSRRSSRSASTSSCACCRWRS